MIRVRGMHKAYRTGKLVNEVLRGVDLDIAEGELVSVIGPSGSGKSTLMHAIGGLDTDYTGAIEVEGRSLHAMGDVELSQYRNRFVGFVFQSFYLLPHLTVLENVSLPSVFTRGGEVLDDAGARKRALEVLEEVELDERGESKPTMLSGGQRQRVAIARALFNRPRLMLCDEPTGNLDSKMGGQIVALFRKLNAAGITIVIVTHDPRVSAATRRRLRVEDGQIHDDSGEAPTEAAEAPTEASAEGHGETLPAGDVEEASA